MIERTRGTDPETIPSALPIFPLPGALLLPGGQLPLNIFEPRYLNMVEDALGSGRLIGMIQPIAENDERQIADGTRVYDIGCIGRIVQFSETGDGRYLISLQGVCRFRIAEELTIKDGYRRVRPDISGFLDDFQSETLAGAGMLEDRDGLTQAMRRYFDLKGISADLDAIDDAPDGILVTSLAMSCPLEPGEKQALLECGDVKDRGRLLTSMFEFALMGGDAPISDTRQ